MDRSFFEHVLDAFEGFVDEASGYPQAQAHGRGLKVWFGPAEGRTAREHFEAQLIRLDGSAALEIGFTPSTPPRPTTRTPSSRCAVRH